MIEKKKQETRHESLTESHDRTIVDFSFRKQWQFLYNIVIIVANLVGNARTLLHSYLLTKLIKETLR